MRTTAGIALALLFAAAPLPAAPRLGADYGVFCVRGRLALDQRRIEELKIIHGDDVCRLDQDATEDGARTKVERLGGVGATCTCP